jgi:hypothetical protein
LQIKSINGKGNMSLIEAYLDADELSSSQPSVAVSLEATPAVAGSQKRTSARF